MEAVRVQKILADAGFGSRRECEAIIRFGEVTINGKIAELGAKAVLGKDHIKVRGKLIHNTLEKVVVALFKPKDYLSAPSIDRPGMPNIFHIMKLKEKVFPIGRLDVDSEGLLLLTNDGELAQRLNKPKYEVPKMYIVKLDGHILEKKIKRLSFGVTIEGVKTKPIRVERLRPTEGQGKEWLRVTMTDTRNRLIRKIFEHVGHPVDKVRREAFAGITLKGLDRGTYRYLKPEEIKKLREWVAIT